MKAKLLINYNNCSCGSEYIINEINGTRCSLLINGSIVDFGLSEVRIICNTKMDLFSTGKDIVSKSQDFIARNSEIENLIKKLKYPLDLKTMRKAVHYFLYGTI